jgi:hypothetical protein
MKSRLLLSAAAGLVALWVVVLGAIHFLHLLVPTAASTTAWVNRQDWSPLTPEERAKRLADLANQMNQMSFDERQKLLARRGLQPLMTQMSEDERLSLMDQTLSRGFAQAIEAINRMKVDDRRRLVTQAVENMKRWDDQQQGPRPGMSDAAMQKVIQTGFSSYLQNASAETKLDLAPLIEQMQINMQGLVNQGP